MVPTSPDNRGFDCVIHTVPLEAMGPFARGKISSLPNMVAVNSLRWDENPNRGKDESNRKPW